ncbi:MAG TPA: T9SS type A sorting domain-containing protein [Chitinophagaceae bacterium]
MKRTLLVVCVLFFGIVKPKAQDIPTPFANLKTLPAGSYVIPMDNNLQTNNAIGVGDFNLNAYGMIVHLLNHNVKLKWVIKTGKAKDEADFSGNAEQIKPAYVAGSVTRNFIAGPFVVDAADTAGVTALIDEFYTTHNLAGTNRPRLFRLSEDVASVDIRYDMTGFKPKAAILTDGGNQQIHVNYMTACKIPTENYALSTGTDLLAKCFTFASEPHNDLTGPTIDATITAIRRFVEYGGNFLAQCAAILNYENNDLGRFQTTGGVTSLNANIGTNLSYPNADLSFSQFQGAYNASRNGTFRNWTISSGINEEHNHAAGTGGNNNAIGASVSKIKTGAGGLVFYVGNHEFSNLQFDGINGIRMYMSAFLTPVSVNNACKTGEVITGTLPVKWISFNGNKNKDRITLEWSIAQNETADRFEVEKSSNGRDFETTGVVFTTEKKGTEGYAYFEKLKSAEKIFYRLKGIDKSQTISYSKTLAFQMEAKASAGQLNIINNPVNNDKLTLSIASSSNQPAEIRVYNITGQQIMQQKTRLSEGNNVVSVPLSANMMTGVYVAEVFNGTDRYSSRFVKQ